MLKPLLIPLALMLVACTYPKEAREPFGSWGEDPEGLPYYEYTGGVPFTAYDENGNRTELPEDPYFLLGNYRIGLIPHASGMYQILTAERGWARLNASEERPDYGVVESSLGMPLRMVSGVGFSRWEYNLEDGINCRRVLSVRPSEAVNEGMPAYCVDVTFSNESDREKNISFTEAIPVNYSPMYSQMQENPVLGYKVKAAADGRLAEASITAELLQYTTEFSPSEATPLDFYPPSFYLQKAGEGEVYASGNTLGFRADVVLQPGQSRTLTFIGGIGSPAGGFLDGTEASAFGRFSSLWKAALPDFSAETDPVFRREMAWNAHFLEASAKYGAYYGETFIPQGSVYSYHYGDNIAARDLLQALLPAIYTNPALAKSALRHLLMHTHPDGEIERGDTGYGYVVPTIYQESDPQLYVFMAVGEYLRVTGDYGFLDESVALAPAECGRTDTVLGVLGRQFTYLRDVIGTGEHGLVRLMNSDWSDSFLHKYSPNITLGEAESHLNSAMASAVIPGLSKQLREGGENVLADALDAYRGAVLEAFLKELEGRPYCARAYVAGELFGDKTVCIEPHSYLFSIPEISPERKREIYDNIYGKIAEPWGLRTRNKPLWGKAPEGEDGGIWFALEYPLLLGVSTFDKNEAWRLLKAFSFDNYARLHPNYWVGHWTAPDELNSSLSRDGLYAFWTGMPDYRLCFQGWCSHPHTWPLYCYYKLKENQSR